MTTFTGVWGNVVVRDDEFLPVDVDECYEAITIDHGYPPLFTWFTTPIDEDHILVAPSSWGMPRRHALARLCQQKTLVYPAWQIATEWVSVDAAECPPPFLMVIECTNVNAAFTLVRRRDAKRMYTHIFPGMGFGPIVDEDEPDPQGQAIEWAVVMASSVRLMIQDLSAECDVVLLTGPSGLQTDACELVCETLRAAGVVSYRISPTDMWVIYKERDWRSDAEHRRDVVEASDEAERKKRFHKPTRAGISMLCMFLVAFLALALAGIFGTDTSTEAHAGGYGNSQVYPHSHYADPGQLLIFPGGMLTLPRDWAVSADTPPEVDVAHNEQWKSIFAPIKQPDLRMLLSVRRDLDRLLNKSLEQQLASPESGFRAWVSPYKWPSNGWLPPLALSYREITGTISRADWVVFYKDRFAYSVGCQYRLRGGLTEKKAHEYCQAILTRINMS